VAVVEQSAARALQSGKLLFLSVVIELKRKEKGT